MRYYFASDANPDTVTIFKQTIEAKDHDEAYDLGDPINVEGKVAGAADFDFRTLLNWTATEQA